MNFSTAKKDAKGAEDDATEDATENNTDTNNTSSINICANSLGGENSKKTTCHPGSSMRNSINETDVDDDKTEDLINVRLSSDIILLDHKDDGEILCRSGSQSSAAALEKPAKDRKVDERAILDCWNLTVASHDGPSIDVPGRTATIAALPSLQSKPPIDTENEYRWQPKNIGDLSSACEDSEDDFLTTWQPKPLALPPWAIDPIEMGFLLERANNNIEGIERSEKRIKRR
mmetsp:Transcript_22418/g.53317  ORF Transcript_22418/g.53317 Transcript_22418/m.53317 type:complete len:231 (+) Transcript_22418:124-816(+)